MIPSLDDGLGHSHRSRRCKLHLSRQHVGIGGGQPNHPGQGDLLLRQIVVKRREPLLLCQRLYLAPVHVDLRRKPHRLALGCLLVQRFGRGHLDSGRLHACACRLHL